VGLEGDLPRGWVADRSGGQPFYVNMETGATTYTNPKYLLHGSHHFRERTRRPRAPLHAV
jgi:hypothetical protein